MSFNFINCDRKQKYLMPLSMEDWLPEDHLSWFVVDAVERMDLSPFRAHYRTDGRGGSAYPPSVMLSLLLYAYCNGERSSRRIEKLCAEDVGYRIVAANKGIDYSTICRFRVRHEPEIKQIFVDVLRLCVEAKLVRLGTIALDGTKIKANAALSANRTLDALKKEVDQILAEAAAKDKEEDKKFGADEKDEPLPAELRTRVDRLSRLKECQERLAQENAALRAEQERKHAQREAEEADSGKKKPGRKPAAPEDVEKKDAKANATDPDSRIMKTQKGYVQGYNAQAAVTQDQIILACPLTQEANDMKQMEPVLSAVAGNLATVGVEEKVGTALMDAGYTSEANLEIAEQRDWDVLGATQKDWKIRKQASFPTTSTESIPGELSRVEKMELRMRTAEGAATYKLRGQTVEPTFGQIKTALGHDRFSRRGFSACESEWGLICSAHNLLKLWRSEMATWN